MQVRDARQDEYDALGELTLAAYAAVHPLDDLAAYAGELRDVRARAAGAQVLAAVADGELLGGVTYVPGPDSPAAEFEDHDAAGIRMLAVAPRAQGRGVGAALTRACLDRAMAAGRRQVVLHVVEDNGAAVRLYERLGFRRDPTLDWEPEPDLRLLGFRRTVEPPPS